MTDDAPDTAVADRLTRALRSVAETTTVSPGAWDAIEDRTAAGPRRRALARWVAVPALAAAVVAALLAAGPLSDDGRQPSVAAGVPVPAFYVLDAAPFVPRSTQTRAGLPAQPGQMQVYGRRGADGVVFDASILIMTVPADANLAPGPGAPEEPGEPIAVHGVEGRRHVVDGTTRVWWTEPDGRLVTVLGRSMAPDEVTAVATGVVVEADGARAGGGLPVGFVEVYGGPPPGGAEALAERTTMQLWSSPPPETGGPSWVSLSVHEGSTLSLDSVAWTLPGGRRTEVAGRPALVEPGVGAIAWSPRAGVLVVLTAGGYVQGPAVGARLTPTERELLDLAERVVPVDEAAWRRLVRGLTGPQARDVPRPLGREGTVVATGGEGTQAWTARASVDGEEVCLDVTTATGGSGTCGPRPSPRQIASVGMSGNLVTAILGEDVAEVEVVLSSGDPVVVETVSAPDVPGAFAVAHLPTGAVPLTLVTRDAAGRELARHDVAPPPGPAPLPGGPPPVTAPAAPPPSAVVPPPGPCPGAPCGSEAAPTTIAVPPVAVTATTTVGG